MPTTPVTQRLLAYWQSKLNGRAAPRRKDILPEELGDLLPWIILVEVMGEPPRFRIRLAGTGVVREYGSEVTGTFVDEMDLGPARDRALKKGDGRWVSYERIALPLSADGERVNMLLCGARVRGAGLHADDGNLLFRSRSVGAKWPD